MTESWPVEHSIHRIIGGSRLYGTDRPDSDVDIRGVCLMPPMALIGLERFDQQQGSGDTVIYGLTKFVRLALDANPNILDILFARPESWIIRTDEWQWFYDNRCKFLSQKVRKTFSGYAMSQLKRIKSHRRWLLEPPGHKPTIEEFGGYLVCDESGGQAVFFPSEAWRNDYNDAVKAWKQYHTWLKNRNPARAKLEKKCGYDCKNASHLVRLLLQAETILRRADYNPRLRGLSLECALQVLNGEWEYDYLIAWAEEQHAKVRTMDSSLPQKPQFKDVQAMLAEVNMQTLERFYDGLA